MVDSHQAGAVVIDYAIGAGLVFCSVMLLLLHQLVWAILPAIGANVVLWSLLWKVK